MQKVDSVSACLEWSRRHIGAKHYSETLWDALCYAAIICREHDLLLSQIGTLPLGQQARYHEFVVAAQYGMGHKHAARESWKAAEGIGEISKQPGLQVTRGEWAVRLGLLKEAHEILEDVPPDTDGVTLLKATLAKAEGRLDAAEKHYHHALTTTPPRLTPLVSLAWLYHECEQPVSSMLHAIAGLDLWRERQEKTLRLLESEATWSLRSFFQKQRQRRYIKACSEIMNLHKEQQLATLMTLLESEARACPQPLLPSPGRSQATAPPGWAQIARDVFGLEALRVAQVDVLEQLTAGHHVLAVMPTGAGKSLCYQLPALQREGLTLVLSPLVALMQDQIASLPRPLQQQAVAIHSALDEEAHKAAMEQLIHGNIRLVYVAPERLRSAPFRLALSQRPLSLLVVDEAHCVSMWGHDFRPDYLALDELHQELGSPQLLALTATAPPHIRADIKRQLLGAAEWIECTTPPRRDNLWLEVLWVEQAENKDGWLQTLCTQSGSGIVYVRTRQRSEELAAWLADTGIAAASYHAGLADRPARQLAFMRGEIRVIVATVAFGMGIDKADIRFVIHDSPPPSIEDLAQQVGRAGRDGLPARCTLFASRSDVQRLYAQAHQEWSLPAMRDLYRLLKQEMAGSEIALLSLTEVAVSMGLDETRARIALSLFAQAGLLKRHVDTPQKLFAHRMEHFQKPANDRPDRSYFEHMKKANIPAQEPTIVDTKTLAKQWQVPVHRLETLLSTWQDAGYLDYEARGYRMALELSTAPQQDNQTMQRLLEQREQSQQRRVEAMLDYLLRDQCRHEAIMRYLEGSSESRGQSCQSCDHCAPYG